MRRAVVGLVLALLVGASLGIGYLAAVEARGAPTETVTPTITSFVTSTIASTPSRQPIPVGSVETGDIPISGYLDPVAVDPDAGRVYIADASSLLVVDASTHSMTADIALPASSNDGIAIDYATDTVYASVQGEVAVVNGSTDKVVGEIPLNLGYLAYDSETGVLYGSTVESQNGSLVAADAKTGAVVANLSLGFQPSSVSLDPSTGLVYAVGCTTVLGCGSALSIVDGTSETLVTTVHLNSQYFPASALDTATGIIYVSGEGQLVALNATTGAVVFDSNPQTCGPFLGMALVPSSDQVLLVPQNYDYLLVYDGGTGNLVNMYSLTGPPQSVAYNPASEEAYVAVSGQLLAFHDSGVTGYVNSTLIGSGEQCAPP